MEFLNQYHINFGEQSIKYVTQGRARRKQLKPKVYAHYKNIFLIQRHVQNVKNLNIYLVV